MILAIILLVLGIICLGIAEMYLFMWIIFTHFPDKTAKTSAKLQKTKHKRDVRIYGSTPGGALQEVAFLKHMTKAKYMYTVAGKDYMIRDDYFGTPRQTPLFVPIKYLKRYPRIACLYSDISVKDFTFICSSFCWFFPAIAMIICCILLLCY